MASSVPTTVTQLLTTTLRVTVSAATASSTSKATPQGGILEGSNPSQYDPKNPIVLFIIQAGIIIIFTRLLHWPLSKLRQPRVIAEVIGGILLGPSVMGRIPGFKAAIFPDASMPNLSLVANLGLVLFLFLVGLEVDLRYVKSNWKVALSVGAAGMALPFGLGCAIAWGLYNQFHNEPGLVPIAFPVFMLFIGIAMAITAFPVLCRILTELKLLSTPVGIIVLSAGVGNDVVGWILLALCVALVNAGTGLTALWVLLTALAYTLLLVFAVRPAFLWVLRRTHSLQEGPSQSIVGLTLLMALTSAFFTGVIGIHPIFGAFLAGLICPHEGGFAIKVTEKVEDLVSTIFLPLYFALSGLSTDIGLLDNGITWAYVIGVLATAFFAKIIGGSGAARMCGLVWRECFTIGALMSCKGLVELIVLNIGLQAKILSTRTFTIFVVMALITTFATTPLVSALYPPWYQKKIEAWKRGEIDWDTGLPPDVSHSPSDYTDAVGKAENAPVKNLLVYLRLDSMPGLLAFLTLLGGNNQSTEAAPAKPSEGALGSRKQRPFTVHGLRLLELTERDSSVMKVAEADEYSAFDPVVNTFRTFGRLQNVPVSGEVAVVPDSYYADTLTSRANEMCSEMMILPWSETGAMSELQTLSPENTRTRLGSAPYNEFVKNVLDDAKCNVSVFVSNGFGGATTYGAQKLSRTYSGISLRSQHGPDFTRMVNQGHRIFVPFTGSRDDRLAVRFALQLAQDARVSVEVLHVAVDMAAEGMEGMAPSPAASPIGAREDGKARFEAAVRESGEQRHHADFLSMMKASLSSEVLSRVTFREHGEMLASWQREVVSKAKEAVGRPTNNAGDMVIAGRNQAGSSSSSLGALGDALVAGGVEASLLVMQACAVIPPSHGTGLA